MTLFLWFTVWITAVISSSDSISISSSSDDSSEYKGILDGEYRDASGQLFNSVCTADNGNIYATSGPLTGDAATDYVSVIGRSISDITKLSNGIFEATFDVFQFNPSTSGVLRVNATFTKNTNTGVATLSFPHADPITLTSISNKGKHCLIPDGNWNDANEETPFMVASDSDETACFGVTNCVDIGRFEDETACFGLYDTDANQFVSGGSAAENVRIVWGGELRISEFTFSDVSCASGTQFDVWTKKKEEITVSWKCATSGFGAIGLRSTDVDVNLLEEVEDEKCPLFSGTPDAKQMSGQNILGDDKNENGNSNVVNQEIVIKFSHTTIGNLWAILIVFMLVTIIMCWFGMRKKSINKTKF